MPSAITTRTSWRRMRWSCSRCSSSTPVTSCTWACKSLTSVLLPLSRKSLRRPRQGGGLEQRQRFGERVLSEHLVRDGNRTHRTDPDRGRGQQLRNVHREHAVGRGKLAVGEP